MVHLNFEKNLSHQDEAVHSTVSIFNGLETELKQGANKQYKNTKFEFLRGFQYFENLKSIMSKNNIDSKIKARSNILDIQMETGTGKTYTYTKTMFELNKLYGIFKFIVVVPTISIKAGTIDFLTSKSSREHFKEMYGKSIQLHIVESKKRNKNSKSFMPPAVSSFVNAGEYQKDKIQVLIINQGMINSQTMVTSFDKTLLDTQTVPFEAIAQTNSIMIIDEPHKFKQDNKTWKNLQKMEPQFIVRYGATFVDEHRENLIYKLTSVDSFNRNLVKGVIGHITEFEEGKNALIKFTNSTGVEATFELNHNSKKSTFKLTKNESLEKVHSQMMGLTIENINKTTLILSNGLELKKGDSLNPYSYSQTLQESMIQRAIQEHFKLEKQFLTREIKIKPLTLFFIDNIEEYRNKDGNIRTLVEQYITAEAQKLLKTETNEVYRNYLEATLKDVSKTHGGYFSKDNSDKDEAIEQEVIEILHDKEKLLSIENPRRFIFSKWTLREGWDNPNIFQICKLRSSGSEISKLQEVGRGLRLPVNEFGNRVKEEQFYLNYFVDFTENTFVEKLINEVNAVSGVVIFNDTQEYLKLTDDMIKQICEKYKLLEEDLLDELDSKDIIKRNNNFKEGGLEYIKKHYSLIFNTGVDSNKIKKASERKHKVSIRTEKYSQLKELWEKINQKVLLTYEIKTEEEFKALLIDFLQDKNYLTQTGIKQKTQKMIIENDKVASLQEEELGYGDSAKLQSISTMKYHTFLEELSRELKINIKTLNNAFKHSNIKINKYLNQSTIRTLKQTFDIYLTREAFTKFQISYQNITQSIHPTSFTNEKGEVLSEIDSFKIGRNSDLKQNVSEKYLLEELYYDSDIEKENIKKNIQSVVVFTKIPQSSIRIPIAGGGTYSPDFAYVVEFKDGIKKLNFIVESKNTEFNENLRKEEKQKIKHTEKLFQDSIKIHFKTQFKNKDIIDLIYEITKEEEKV
ncbi:MAG: type III restriction-modification system endonuclease [Candidatus Woesearchaeota archaeon]